MPGDAVCITIPRVTGECWVFLDTTPPTYTFNREFRCHAEAVGYAEELSQLMKLPIEDAGAGGADIRFDAYQARVNELLWFMTTIVHADELQWDTPEFWSNCARQQAEIIASSGASMSGSDMAVAMALGAAMLRKGAQDLGVDSVDDVLPGIMIVDPR